MNTVPPKTRPYEQLERLFDLFPEDSTRRILDALPPDFRSALVRSFGVHSGKGIRLNVVVDANALIKTVHRLAVGRTSLFWDLVRSGYIKCWAPTQLGEDMKGKLDDLASQLGKPSNQIWEIWKRQVGPYVSIESESAAPVEVAERLDRLRKRDPEDLPYVELCVTIAADGVVSYDPDIIQDGHVRVLQFGEAIRIASVLRRGHLATTIQLHASLTGLVLGSVLVFALIELAKGLVSLISRIPIPVLIGVGLALLLLLLIPQTRQLLKDAWSKVEAWALSLWSQSKDAIAELWKVWGPIFADSFTVRTEAEELSPPIQKTRRRRTAASFEKRVVELLRKAKRAMRPSEVARVMVPAIAACDLSRLCHRIRGVLRKNAEVRRIRFGFYAVRA